MVPWDVYTMPRDEGGLGLIDIASPGSILVSGQLDFWKVLILGKF